MTKAQEAFMAAALDFADGLHGSDSFDLVLGFLRREMRYYSAKQFARMVSAYLALVSASAVAPEGAAPDASGGPDGAS